MKKSSRHVCTNPKIGRLRVAYALGHLSDEERTLVEQHLFECEYCANDLTEDAEILNLAASAIVRGGNQTDRSFLNEQPLPVSAVYDRKQRSLMDLYDGQPVPERLAAAGSDDEKIAFPVTIEYANGQVIGQIRKRANQAFFRLERLTMEPHTCRVRLVYRSQRNPSHTRMYDIQAEEELPLGPFQTYFPTETVQGIAEGLRQFQVVLLPAPA